jgi:hypothetical protein
MVRDTTFSSICIPVKVPHQLTYYGSVITFSLPPRSYSYVSISSLTNAFSQLVILVLTIWRHVLTLRHGLRLPIVTLMVRDGAITFASVFSS